MNLAVGACVFSLWAALAIDQFGPWQMVEFLWWWMFAKFVLHLFHRKRRLWKITAVILSPVLLWTYLLPKEIKWRLKELKALEQAQP